MPAREAVTYIDPGTGSVVLQAILAGVAGLAVLARLFWRRLTGLFRRGDRPPQ